MPMKPIQFSQNKLEADWQWMFANHNTTILTTQLEAIRKHSPITGRTLNSLQTKRKTAELLYEYYSILFSPEHEHVFWPMANLEYLFPTGEFIYILSDTNFILLPINTPTYPEWTCRGNGTFNYPFLSNSIQTNELIHDMDFAEDNISTAKQRHPTQAQLERYPHTNPMLKFDWTHAPLDNTARLWTYKFRDVSPKDRDRLNLINGYDLKSVPSYKLLHKPIDRKYTLLEITPPNNNGAKGQTVRLKDYSLTHLQPSQLDKNFPSLFNRSEERKSAIIEYLINNSYCNQFSIPEIKSGINKLKNIIAYKSTPILNS